MSLYRNAYFIVHGLSEFTKGGYDKAAKSFTPGALDVDCTGKVAVVTGANSGIGKEVALALARRGATVYMVCRSADKAEEARKEIVEATKNQNVFVKLVDLSNLRQIGSFAEEFKKESDRLDVLVNNGGSMNNTRVETPDGIEANFATNTLGTYHLTNSLLDLMEKTGNARVITVSSGGMLTMKLDPKDLNSNHITKFDGTFSYAANKRQQVVLTEHWAKQYASKGIQFYSCHPGWADTPGVRTSMPGFYENMKDKLRSAEEGADTVVWLAIAAEVPEKVKSGDFVQDRKAVKKHFPLAWTHHTAAEEQSFLQQVEEYVKKATAPKEAPATSEQ